MWNKDVLQQHPTIEALLHDVKFMVKQFLDFLPAKDVSGLSRDRTHGTNFPAVFQRNRCFDALRSVPEI